MGHRRWKHPRLWLSTRPSMGPPPFSDGNGGWETKPRYGCRPFNGATAFQRWKRRVGDETPVWLSTLQWGHRLSAMETAGGRPKPRYGWKLSTLQDLQWGHRLSAMEMNGHPSMGPPPFSDGNWLGGLMVGFPGFLQWGHRLSAMETRVARLDNVDPVGNAPSMGPPPFSDGNGEILRLLYDRCLQWGHRLSAMETWLAEVSPPWPTSFNGATAFQRWKRPLMAAPFNGATAFQRWKRCGCDVPHSCPFNGATAFQRWKPVQVAER